MAVYGASSSYVIIAAYMVAMVLLIQLMNHVFPKLNF